MTPSNKQLAIYDQWENTDNNLLIQAVAGSGKTTTLLEILRRCKHRTLFLAFNKSIQTEIQGIIDEKKLLQGKAMTLHALGIKAIRTKHKKFKINNYKNYELVKQIQNEYYNMFRYLKWEDKMKLSYTLMDMNDISRIYLTDDIDEIKNYMTSMDKSFFDIYVDDEDSVIETIWEDFVDIRKESYEKPFIEIDFHDMIYLPVYKDLTIPIHPYYLMVDEAQDLNLAQHRLIDKLISQGTISKWVAVGDRHQAIYGFSGAHGNSFDLFAEKDNVVELPLDICYRCPIDVVNSANEVYDIMTAFKTYTGIVQNIPHHSDIKENSMIICRNSAPLFSLYFQLISDGRKVVMKGEDIIGPLNKFLKPYKYKTITTANNAMLRQLNKLLNNLKDTSKNENFKYYKFKQNFDVFEILKNNLCSEDSTVEELLNKIRDIFKSNVGTITLSTIHKSKGLESDIVYILNEHLIPSPFARSSQQLQQEQNLKYVARTRAKEELYFLTI